MITNVNITIFNARYNADDRTEVLVPTIIKGASFLESEAANTNDGVWTPESVYKLRIPYLGAEIPGSYVEAPIYKAMEDVTGKWTLRKGDYILLDEYGGGELTKPALDEYVKANGLKVITITEYADNTIRGTDTVKHWRIGGN